MTVTNIISLILNKFVDAVGIFVIGFTLAAIVKGITGKILRKIKLNKVANLAGIIVDLETGIANTLSYIIYAGTLIWLIERLQIAKATLLIFTFLVIFLIGLSLLSHTKDLPLNLWGYYMIRKQQGKFKKGKYIKTSQIEGVIKHTSLTETVIETKQGDLFYTPNYALINK